MFLDVNPQGQNNMQVYHFATQVHTHRVALGHLMELTSSCAISCRVTLNAQVY